ncbi:PaaI family thioesterase [Cupriavidus sp. CV2]|uniref:PaaI family thioesterase n=1 Tax=Cupriavidus ulmosensis TaxID=3065913 RepID=UPI00296B128A|nr:PaaI family thioesterase [Cupriavidus sp. CV2]MDW3688067.1 PaaI family thioesterase [Cupriavidus sp. CV2]
MTANTSSTNATTSATTSATTNSAYSLDAVKRVNQTAAFNRWLGFEVIRAEGGAAELRMAWHDQATQYAGFLHAGVIGALVDTACGFAATTVAGPVMASHYSVNCMAPAVGQAFVARASVTKAGKRHVFARAEVFAEQSGGELRLVASGEVILVPVDAQTPKPPVPHD